MVVELKTETEQLVKRPYLEEMNVQEIIQKHNPATVMDVLVNILISICHSASHSVVRYDNKTPNITQLTACGEHGVLGKHALRPVEAALKTEPEQSHNRLCLVAMNAQGMSRKHSPATIMVALVNIIIMMCHSVIRYLDKYPIIHS